MGNVEAENRQAQEGMSLQFNDGVADAQNGRRQLSWPPDDNYLGRSEAGNV